MSAIKTKATVWHGTVATHDFDLNKGIVALAGADKHFGLDIQLAAGEAYAIPMDAHFPAAGFVSVRQADGSIARIKIGYADRADPLAVDRWHTTNADAAGLFNYAKGDGFDVQLPGHAKFLLIMNQGNLSSARSVRASFVANI